MAEESTQEQNDDQALRKELAGEIWGSEGSEETTITEAAKADDVVIEKEVTTDDGVVVVDEEPAQDEWEGVNPTLRKSFEKISSQLESLSAIESRLKQTERRIGSMQNEMSGAKKVAAEAKVESPTKEQMAEAAKTESEWDELKEDFPEWASAIEAKLAANSTEIVKGLPNTEKINSDMAGMTTKLSEMSTEIQKNKISFKHPGWKAIIDSKEYAAWIAGQPEDIRSKTKSLEAEDAIVVLDKFEVDRPKKSPAAIAADRKKRLKESTVVAGQKTVNTSKSSEDMTDEEYRRKVSKEIWDG